MFYLVSNELPVNAIKMFTAATVGNMAFDITVSTPGSKRFIFGCLLFLNISLYMFCQLF